MLYKRRKKIMRYKTKYNLFGIYTNLLVYLLPYVFVQKSDDLLFGEPPILWKGLKRVINTVFSREVFVWEVSFVRDFYTTVMEKSSGFDDSDLNHSHRKSQCSVKSTKGQLILMDKNSVETMCRHLQTV